MVIENDELGDHPEDEYLEDEYSDEEYSDEEYSDEEYSDEEYSDEEEFEEDRRISSESSSRSRKKKRRMFCRGCNRMENHRYGSRRSWINSYITGLTFGLNRFVGPFKCTCCGTNRWIVRLKRSNVVSIKR